MFLEITIRPTLFLFHNYSTHLRTFSSIANCFLSTTFSELFFTKVAALFFKHSLCFTMYHGVEIFCAEMIFIFEGIFRTIKALFHVLEGIIRGFAVISSIATFFEKFSSYVIFENVSHFIYFETACLYSFVWALLLWSNKTQLSKLLLLLFSFIIL